MSLAFYVCSILIVMVLLSRNPQKKKALQQVAELLSSQLAGVYNKSDGKANLNDHQWPKINDLRTQHDAAISCHIIKI